MGICKINIDTDLRLAMTSTIREELAKNPGEFDPRKYLGPARDAVKSIVKHKIKTYWVHLIRYKKGGFYPFFDYNSIMTDYFSNTYLKDIILRKREYFSIISAYLSFIISIVLSLSLGSFSFSFLDTTVSDFSSSSSITIISPI